MTTAVLYLASQSPRRAALLDQIGVRFNRFPVDIDETPSADESSDDYLQRMALSKAEAAQARLREQGIDWHKAVVLAADTIGELDGQILAKPRDLQDAQAMLGAMSGRNHTVASGVCVMKGDKCQYLEVKTQVRLRNIDSAEIERYWNTGEPQDKACAYGIQGLAAVFVESIQGSYSNVVGLPLAETSAALEDFGVRIWQREQH